MTTVQGCRRRTTDTLRGARFDEKVSETGLGLAMVHDLASLYSGSICSGAPAPGAAGGVDPPGRLTYSSTRARPRHHAPLIFTSLHPYTSLVGGVLTQREE